MAKFLREDGCHLVSKEWNMGQLNFDKKKNLMDWPGGGGVGLGGIWNWQGGQGSRKGHLAMRNTKHKWEGITKATFCSLTVPQCGPHYTSVNCI